MAGSFSYNMWKLSFWNSFCLFQNFNVKVRVCISLICRNSDIIATSTFSYIRSLGRHISFLSRCIYTFRRMELSVVLFIFPSKIGKCTEQKNLEKIVPNFFIWIVYSTHTRILNKSKLEFEYLGVLHVPMNFRLYCIRFCLNNYGD